MEENKNVQNKKTKKKKVKKIKKKQKNINAGIVFFSLAEVLIVGGFVLRVFYLKKKSRCSKSGF